MPLTLAAATSAAGLPLYLLLPLASSLLYVCGALSLRRASQERAGVWRTTFVSNIVAAALFIPLPFIPPLMPPVAGPTPLWQPILMGLAFAAGQACTIYALNRGEVSVATPVIGTKVIFVAFFATLLLGMTLGPKLWASAAMSAAGIALLNLGRREGREHVGRTVVASLAAAACYAIFDVTVRLWGANWGAGRLLPMVYLVAVVASLALLPVMEGPPWRIPRPAVRPLLVGTGLIGLQSLILAITLATFPNVTQINVVYNARGLWSVLAVWLIGHWWGNQEMAGGGTTFAWRMAGATLMLGAIVLAVV